MMQDRLLGSRHPTERADLVQLTFSLRQPRSMPSSTKCQFSVLRTYSEQLKVTLVYVSLMRNVFIVYTIYMRNISYRHTTGH